MGEEHGAVEKPFLVVAGDNALGVSVGIIRAIHIFRGDRDSPVYPFRSGIVLCYLLNCHPGVEVGFGKDLKM